MHNEPDGMRERLIEECISWVEARLPDSVAKAGEEGSSAKL